jgi:hypothetical protein
MVAVVGPDDYMSIMNQDSRLHSVFDMRVVVMDQDDYMSITNQDFRQQSVIDVILLCGAGCDFTRYYPVISPSPHCYCWYHT